mgnify:CR=1 FL=1
MARVTAPLVWLLDNSTNLVLRLLGLKKGNDQEVTAEELHMIFTEATHSGVIEAGQSEILAGVVRLADRPVRALMTPRTELDWLDLHAPEVDLRARIETMLSEGSSITISDTGIGQETGDGTDFITVTRNKPKA